MRFRIHFELSDGAEDSFELKADTVEEIRDQAIEELYKRCGQNPWSEELKQAAN
jgi:hypothetical protein